MIIIGAGRVGGALAAAGQQHGQAVTLIDRERHWDALETVEGPVVVATRNDDLDAVVARVPSPRHGDLVFVQNGMLRDWLRDKGLREVTRGLLFFAVPSRGAAIQPGGASPFVGPRAADVVRFMTAIDVPAEVVEPDAFAEVELEKLIWNCAFGLLCQRFDATVGELIEQPATHETNETMQALFDELIAVGGQAMGLELDQASRRALKARLVSYSRSIPNYKGAVKEVAWRNGWFVEAARVNAVHTPVHDELLDAIGMS